MAWLELNKTTNVNKVPISTDILHGTLFTKEQNAHKFIITCVKDDEEVALSGTATGYVMLSNGDTLQLLSTSTPAYAGIENGKAWVVLPQACYAVPGRFQLSVMNTTTDGAVTCVYAAVGMIRCASNGTIYDPGEAIPSAEQLALWIEQCRTATADANEAATKSVRYDSAQTLTDAQKTQARGNIEAASADDVSDLKSAIKVDSDMFMDSQKGAFDLDIVWEIGTYDNFQPVDLNTRCRSVRAHTVPGKYAYITLPEGLRMFVLDKTDQSSSTVTASGPFVFNDSHEYYFAVRHYPTNDAFTDTSEAEAIKITFASAFETIKDCVDANNYSTILPDANNAPANTLYRFFLDTGVTSYTANLPDIQERINLGATFALLETIGSNAHNCYLLQRFYTDNDIWQRYKLTETGTYTSWVKFSSQYMQERKPYIRSTNVNTRLSDLNNANVNRYYICYLTVSGDKPANLPFTVTGASIVLVMTYGSETYRVQMCQYNGQIWHREYVSGTWTTWINTLDPLLKTFKVGASDSLAAIIETAIKTANSTVYVSGEHDILSEYQALHPDDWDTRNDGRGINLNNGIKLIFNSGASIVCNYTGSDENVMTNFSALNVRYGSAEIINAKITAKNVRYCVHDDMWTSSSPYHVLYKDCVMDIDNSENPYTNKPHCIGGGFGKSGHIDIENCVFTGKGATNPAPDDNGIVSWHNGPNASQYSVLTMTGCYFTGTGTFRVMSNGAATEKSKLIISNNSFGSAIVEGFESGASVDNMDVIAFNNEVRSN